MAKSGPVAAVGDRASADIDAIHPAMVQRARGLGLPVLDGAAAVTELLQFPLRATGAETSLQSHAISNYVDMSSGRRVTSRAAKFPLRVTCTNTPPELFSRTTTTLVLSSP